MKLKELKGKTESELKKIIQDWREKLRQLRFDLSCRKSKECQGNQNY